MKIRKFKILKVFFAVLASFITFAVCASVFAEPETNTLWGQLGLENSPESMTTTVQVAVLLTLLSLLPSILIMTTSFTRIVIVMSFIRNAIGVQQSPPNQVIVGISLFLTLFVMSPVIGDIKTTAYDPYVAGEITQEVALENAAKPLREFMLRQTYTKDLNMFMSLAKSEVPESYDDIPMETIIPAFITSEIKRAFQMGFFLYIPFIVIDMVVASTLMSMGMMMLPPVMISLPFKLMLFILVDGWGLLIKTLVSSFG
ncbi:MAG: flagellar type III secretion system pore protein FliP [Oscillospiraceae bacterium]|nr:flagellar type III secretion system pore protein FliP [Oscillospiraceae bacterium]